jgi:uncharacterized protein (TIGR03067 family)
MRARPSVPSLLAWDGAAYTRVEVIQDAYTRREGERPMRRHCLVALLVVVATLVSGCSALSRSDSASLQGTWAGSLKYQPSVEVTLAVAGAQATFEAPTSQEWYAGAITLDQKAKPKELDFSIEDCSSPDLAGLVVRAIYEIDGDTLTMAAGEPGDDWRPTSFEEEYDPRVFILTRQEP